MIATIGAADSLLAGPFWFAGAVLLGGGALLAWLVRTPSWRVRIAELSFLGMVAWLLLALVPLPRLAQDESLVVDAPMQWVHVVDMQQRPSAPTNLAAQPSRVDPVAAASVPAAVAKADGAWPSLAAIWLLIAAVSLASLLVGALLLWRLLRQSREADRGVMQLVDEVAERLHLQRPVRVLVHPHLKAPFCCRVATVVLPADLLDDRSALRAVLAHELAHIAARDPLRRAAFALLTPWLALHPAWWLLRRMAVQASEEAADARAALALGRVASRYARPLIELSARLGRSGAVPMHPSTVGVLGQPTDFTRRMTMLLTRDPALAARSLNRSQRWLAACSALLMVAGTVGAWGTPASAQDPLTRQDPRRHSGLDTQIKPDFVNCALHDALRFVARRARVKIAIDSEVAARKIVIIGLQLGEMPARRLLDTLAVAHDLRWSEESGTVVFRPGRSRAIKATANAAKSAQASQELDRLLGKGARIADFEVTLDQDTGVVVELLRKAVQPEAVSPPLNVSQAPQGVLEKLLGQDQPPGVFGRLLQGGGKDPVTKRDGKPRRGQAVVDPLVQVMIDQGDYEAALRLVSELLKTDPERAALWLSRAKVYESLGKNEQASQDLERASALAPDRAQIIRALARAHQANGRHDEASAAYRRAIALDPALLPELVRESQFPWDVLKGSGETQPEKGRDPSSGPTALEVALEVATSLEQSGEFAGAGEVYRRAAKLDPRSVEVLMGLARVLLAQGRNEEAVVLLRRAMAIQPSEAARRSLQAARAKAEQAAKPKAKPAGKKIY